MRVFDAVEDGQDGSGRIRPHQFAVQVREVTETQSARGRANEESWTQRGRGCTLQSRTVCVLAVCEVDESGGMMRSRSSRQGRAHGKLQRARLLLSSAPARWAAAAGATHAVAVSCVLHVRTRGVNVGERAERAAPTSCGRTATERDKREKQKNNGDNAGSWHRVLV